MHAGPGLDLDAPVLADRQPLYSADRARAGRLTRGGGGLTEASMLAMSIVGWVLKC